MKYKIIFQILLCCLLFTIPLLPQYKKVAANGFDIYYRIIGGGEPLLIIGGGPGDNSDRYLGLCELLSGNFKCILADQRGCGKSAPPVYDSTTISVNKTIDDFENIRKELNLKNWHILGFSYGGFLASCYAEKYPESISSMILLGSMGLNANSFATFMDNVKSRLTQNDLDIVEYWSDSVRYNKNPHQAICEMIKAKMPGYFFDRKKSLLVSQVITDNDFNFEMGEWIWNDIIGNKIDLKMNRPKYNGRVLILYGRQDPAGEGVAIELNNYYKNSKLVFVEKAGHYSWVEQPQKIKAFISGFYKNE